jgi:hypothetical protein
MEIVLTVAICEALDAETKVDEEDGYKGCIEDVPHLTRYFRAMGRMEGRGRTFAI